MNVISVSDFSQKKVLLDGFRPQRDTWVVSDLQSKWEIQNRLLTDNAVLEEEAVLRASEFWVKLLFRVRSKWTLVSRELFDQWIWNWLRENPLSWIKANESASLVHAHLEFFAPLFLEEENGELLEEWFDKNPDSVIRWRHLYEICQRLWEDLSQAGIVSPSLVPVVLLHELQEESQQEWSQSLWPRKIFLDLGPQPRSVERRLAEKLSERLEVVFIETQTDLKGLALEGALLRLPTQLGEAKQAVALVRRLLEEGHAPKEIALLAPDIERFWPSLHYLFKTEGVPCNKPFVQRLIDDPCVQKWMSSLRIKLEKFTRKDLESFFFQKTARAEMSFEDFRYYFETLKNPGDATRWSGWKSGEKAPAEPLSLVEFFEWALLSWPKDFKAEALERVWKTLSRDYDPRLRMTAPHWFFYVESKISKAETPVEEAVREGIQLLSLSSAEWSAAKSVIFMGLNESDLTANSPLAVSKFEMEKLKQDLGFELDGNALSVDELYLGWIARKEFQEKFFLTSGVTFSGDEVSPSKYWLRSAFSKGKEKVGEVLSPQPTRFDELARGIESGETPFQPVPLPEISLSATGIKSYFTCPFTFFASKALKLSDQPVLDFDLDPMSKGRILHGVLEEVVGDLAAYEDDQAVRDLIERQKEKLGVALGEEKLWPAMREELFKLTGHFIVMEKELRTLHPQMKNLGLELGFEAYFDVEKEKIFKEKKNPTDVKITGRMDRVDGDGAGGAVIVDYKLSSGRLKGWKGWLEDGDLQMPLYSLVLEEGATDLGENLQVNAAYYLVPRTRERDKGFFVKDSEGVFVPPSPRSHSWTTEEKKSELLGETTALLKEVSGKMRAGLLAPEPKKFETCETCRWRRLCRAPHLI